MPGFNYGGKGDGTGWSSESGGTEPGGGGKGNAGDRDNNNNSSAYQQQVDSIRNDPVSRQKLAALIQAAVNINYAAKIQIVGIDASGRMTITIVGLTPSQAGSIGLSGVIVGTDLNGINTSIGSFETGHKLPNYHPSQPENGDLTGLNNEIAAETSYQANYLSMLERARQLAQSQSVGAADTEVLRANFIRDRAGFRPADLAAINAELDRATLAETGYQANYRSMLERARQLAQSQSVGAADTEVLRANFIRDRASFRPADLAAINAELDRATVEETGYQANYRSMLERARQLARSQSVGAADTEVLRANFIRDREGFRPADLAAINAELDRATLAEEQRNAQDVLTKASEIIADMGDKLGEYLGDKYKAVAKEIADNIANFQGKKIRSFDDAMASLNKITSNPSLKINTADKNAIINAWKHVDASSMANKLGNLARAFKVVDVTLKVEKVREKSIEGYETGNWKPLMLEVESWVLSGVASAGAMGMLAIMLSLTPFSGLAITAITIMGIMAISYYASLIDDEIADKINNEVLRSAN